MITEYLLPVNKEIVNFKNELPQLSIGKNISFYSSKNLNLNEVDIAIIGLKETIISKENNNEYLEVNSFRKEFYSLYLGDWKINIIDLGDVINWESKFDTYYAVRSINEVLKNKNILSFFIGGSQDITFPVYQSYAFREEYVNLTSIDNKFDFGQITDDFD